MVEKLLAEGADINALPGKHYGRTALEAADWEGYTEMAELLRKKVAKH